jgi:hypothetical protein
MFLVAVFPLEARAMTGTGSCQVVAGEKYLAPNGSRAICAEIARAIAAQAPGVRYRAEIRALSPSRLAGALIVNGRALPEHKFAVMDSDLSPAAVQRFAHSLAIAVADAAKR